MATRNKFRCMSTSGRGMKEQWENGWRDTSPLQPASTTTNISPKQWKDGGQPGGGQPRLLISLSGDVCMQVPQGLAEGIHRRQSYIFLGSNPLSSQCQQWVVGSAGKHYAK